MLREHNTVVKRCGFCLTQGEVASSLCIVKAGFPVFPARWARILGKWLLVSGFALVIGACAVIERAEIDSAKAVVSERAQQRWELLMSGQVEKAYAYYSPASRSSESLELFRKKTAGVRWWRNLKLDSVVCRPDACQVRMLLEYDLFEIKGLKQSVEETWVKDSGNWWLVAGG